ncbi:MAG: FAD-dependent oxidoreductase, partial [Rhodospirillales bacterium]|nr:FAD-dependent oxidoreductase [Rhodospirillales bacterium]
MDTIDFDVAVIGAGIAGSTAAAALAPHKRVVLVEAEEAPGYHTTGRSAAIWILNYGPPDVRAHKTVQYATAAGTHEVRFARGDREPALLAFLALGMGENTAESWALAAREV